MSWTKTARCAVCCRVGQMHRSPQHQHHSLVPAVAAVAVWALVLTGGWVLWRICATSPTMRMTPPNWPKCNRTGRFRTAPCPLRFPNWAARSPARFQTGQPQLLLTTPPSLVRPGPSMSRSQLVLSASEPSPNRPWVRISLTTPSFRRPSSRPTCSKPKADMRHADY